MTDTPYLQRLAERHLLEKIKQNAAFGQILGVAFGLYGMLGYFAGMEHSDAWYICWWVAGGLLLAAGLAYPLCLEKASDLFRLLAGKLGRLIFGVLLTCIYFVLILPFGLFFGKSSPSQPFASWQPGAKAGGYAWYPKVVNTMTNANGVAGLGSTFYAVLRYFVERGQWFLLPLVILLLAAGLLLFFAQTSTIAPFIYTLF